MRPTLNRYIRVAAAVAIGGMTFSCGGNQPNQTVVLLPQDALCNAGDTALARDRGLDQPPSSLREQTATAIGVFQNSMTINVGTTASSNPMAHPNKNMAPSRTYLPLQDLEL